MDEATLTALLEAVRSGEVAPDDAVHQLRRLPWADLGFARVDHHRALRQGMAEVVYGPGKAVEHVVAIVGELLDGGEGPVLVSRASAEQAAAALEAHPGGVATTAPSCGGRRRPAPSGSCSPAPARPTSPSPTSAPPSSAPTA